MARWRPRLSSAGSMPLYRKLAEALAADIAAGKLAAGTRLPPQRDLAQALSISVGAVTRAYEEAARRGLVHPHVGRGTFVADRSHASVVQAGPIDLSINTAPIAPFDAMVETLAVLRRPASWMDRLAYLPPCGLEVDRRAAASWLTRSAGYDGLDWRTLLCCSGAQNALAIALGALCKPGDTILCEAATFSGAKALAEQQGYRLHGVEMDGQGVLPDALDRAAASSGARVFYVLPTLQNPTARTMGRERRTDVVRIARARNLWLVEDDVYAPYARHLQLPPIAALAPERTFYLSSWSKILAPGLRTGFLVAPAGEPFDRCVRVVRALMHSPAGISAAIATDWIQSGRADELTSATRSETEVRTAMALAALPGTIETPQTAASLHLWLPMGAIDAERIAARALTAGVRLTSPGAFSVAGSNSESGLRLCVGSAANRATLERALSILNVALKGEVDDPTGASL
jgi:DNA-binding transcriptional MocR family regulator